MRTLALSLSLALGLTLGWGASIGEAASDSVMPGSQVDSTAQVTNVRVEGDTVHGVLVNKSSQTLRDIRIVVRRAWLWNDERNPGSDNPGSSEFFTFEGEVPPGASTPFTHRLKAGQTTRTDGKFATSAEVLSFTLVGP